MVINPEINKGNVGRIAERIVANEVEWRGFQVSDLNKEVTAANADLLAAKSGKALQVQVKGSTWEPVPTSLATWLAGTIDTSGHGHTP